MINTTGVLDAELIYTTKDDAHPTVTGASEYCIVDYDGYTTTSTTYDVDVSYIEITIN